MMEGEKAEPTSPTKKKNSMTIEDFIVGRRLGRGAYGDVFHVVKISDGKEYALKQIQKKKLGRQQKQYQAMVEKQLLTCLKHSGIITLRYAFQDSKNLNFVLEYCRGGDFTTFIKFNLTHLTPQLKIFYVAEIINILEYLHSNGITHRDLKPENLMLDRRGHLKLIDFGTAQITNCTLLSAQFKENILKLKKKSDEVEKAMEKSQQYQQQQQSPLKKRRSTFVGTCYYISPQLLEHNYCPPSADLWALGCIIYQLYYLQTPFKDNYQFAVFQKIKKAEVFYPKNQFVTDETIDLIKQLLVKNPEQRLGSCSNEQLSFAKLKAHPYFQGLNVDNIFNSPVPYVPDLQEPEKNEKEKLASEEEFNKFSQSVENIIQQRIKEGKQIVKHSIVEQKVFVDYIYSLLILCKGGDISFISIDKLTERKQLKLRKAQIVIKATGEDKLELYADDKTYHLRVPAAEQWVKAVEIQLKRQ